jgi:SAM-dependent methyltransferase
VSARDPKAVAQERFAGRDWNERGMSLVERCATDPPIVVRGLLDAVRHRAPAGGRVIELGFGSGWFFEVMRDELTDVALFGLDLSEGFARRAHEAYGDKVRVLLGDMERLPFRDSTFDVIVTCWTLYFMRDIDAALIEIKRCLTRSGRLIAGTNAPAHEAECGELVSEAIRLALGRDEPDHDLARRFDLETGATHVRRHFPKVDLQEWNGEMVIADSGDIEALWPKWEPAMMQKREQQAVRTQFLRLARERLEREGALRIRRRNGAFICDL